MAREVWAGVMFHILFSVLSTMLVDGVYLELSKNPGRYRINGQQPTSWRSLGHIIIWIKSINQFLEIRQKIFFEFKCKIVIQCSTTRDNKILVEENIQ